MVQLTKENLIYIGASGTIAVAALALIGSGIFSGATTEGLEIGQTSIRKASGDAVITIAVKNAGTSEITGLTVTINGVDLKSTSTTEYPAIGSTGSHIFETDTIITSGDADDAVIQFRNDTKSLNAGQTTSFSGTMPGTEELVVGDSFVITATGQIDGSGDITATAVATVTRF